MNPYYGFPPEGTRIHFSLEILGQCSAKDARNGENRHLRDSFVPRKEFNTPHYHEETKSPLETSRETSTEERQLVADPCTVLSSYLVQLVS